MLMIRLILICVSCCLSIGIVTANARAQEQLKSLLVYVGTYTGGPSQGIYAYRLDLENGTCLPLGLAAEMQNPSFLAIHPNSRYLYAVSEVGEIDGKPSGGVNAFVIDRQSGMLEPLNGQLSQGVWPCHVIVDRLGRTVLVANYGSGTVASLPIAEDGSLEPAASAIQHQGRGIDPQRQQGPHAHSINVGPSNGFAVAADLGLDQLLVYKLDPSTSELTPNDPPFVMVQPGSGPRHLAFHLSGKFAYVINEMACTITLLAYDAGRGAFAVLETVGALPPGETHQPAYSGAEIQVHPSGDFVYASFRGHDSISVFAVDSSTGKLRFLQNESTRGKTPRGFGVDPTGHFLLADNQDSDMITVFRIDPSTGRLAPTGQSLCVAKPVA